MTPNPYLDPNSKGRQGYEICVQIICSHREGEDEHAPDWRNEYNLMLYGDEALAVMEAINAVLAKAAEPRE